MLMLKHAFIVYELVDVLVIHSMSINLEAIKTY